MYGIGLLRFLYVSNGFSKMYKDITVRESELDRILALSNLAIDYFEPNQGLDYLTEMAAKVSGTKISMVNLIDNFTQWSISSFGVNITQLPKEDSICQYTIQEEPGGTFEVSDLSDDPRFQDLFYVAGDPHLRYYMGIPLTSPEGYNLGSLCVMDSDISSLSQDVRDLLKLISRQIVDRLMVNNLVTSLKSQLKRSETNQKKLAHDFRGPIGGIIGLTDLILEDVEAQDLKELEEFLSLINQSGKSLLALSDDILEKDFDTATNHLSRMKENEINLIHLKEKITNLLAPQIKMKNITFNLNLEESNLHVPFQKLYILQILGNLLSNSIKFTEPGGKIEVEMSLKFQDVNLWLELIVKDNGIGISPEKISEIMAQGTSSRLGTEGEKGYGLGLTVVKQLVDERKGTIKVSSDPNQGTKFDILLQVN